MTNHDYIVVGAGSAGCVLAARLSEDPSTRVLLLEAGGRDSNPWIHIPVGYFKTMHDPATDWRYKTEPEPQLNGRTLEWPRGKVLGGSSSINGLLYVRGQPQDFDHWRQLGNAGWSFDDVLPYFIRAEDQQRGADEWHGTGGPLAVSDMRVRRDVCDAFIAGAEEVGIPRNDDINGARQEGAGYFQLTARNGRRWSTAVGYLRPARRRPNLRTVTGAHVHRLCFDGRRAVGVRYAVGADVREARAGAEVLLCAGAIGSPQILQLSGVGPGEMLRGARNRARARPPRRRRKPPGPPPAPRRVQVHPPDPERRGEQPRPKGAHRSRVSPHAQRADEHGCEPGLRVRPHSSGARDAGHPVPLSAAERRQAGRRGCTDSRRLPRRYVSSARRAAAVSASSTPIRTRIPPSSPTTSRLRWIG